MALALYRKYRPQTFADLTDQVHIRVTLENEIQTGKIAHAYLFAGPRGVGKTTTARILAKAINCTSRNGAEPCGACPACVSIQENRAMDIVEIDAASNTGVDAVRENIIEAVRFTTSALAYKVFIIDEVHMLSTAAFNALLKTLEEPPAHVVFILATTETHKVPATILSRCQRFDFHKISLAHLTDRLALLATHEGVEVDRDVLVAVARAGAGSVRDAESLLGQVLAIGEKRITTQEAALVLPHSDVDLARQFLALIDNRAGGGALQFIDRLILEGVDLPRFAADTLLLLRLAVRAALQERSGLSDVTEEQALFVTDVLATWPLYRLRQAIEVMIEAEGHLKHGDGEPLPLELAAVSLLEGSAAPSVVEPVVVPKAPAPKPEPSVAVAPRKAEMETPAPLFIPAAGETPAMVSPRTDQSQSAAGPISTKLEDVKAKWKELNLIVGEQSHSLTFILNSSQPQRMDGNCLVIGVPFAFHKDRLNEPKNQKILGDACSTLFGETIMTDAEVVEGLQNPASEVANVHMDDPVIKNVLDAFGGRVVG